ncbi:unnamed protein product [Phytophthora fragariaefolia]|uniref:Unnamed protein product n=1 Tax=Phytophthora fragariaefolia TaxID=1490495 RepID=A0A9W6TVP4_9STRA|nr:unnamed protein product [Phytophthora fragariaefolia]
MWFSLEVDGRETKPCHDAEKDEDYNPHEELDGGVDDDDEDPDEASDDGVRSVPPSVVILRSVHFQDAQGQVADQDEVKGEFSGKSKSGSVWSKKPMTKFGVRALEDWVDFMEENVEALWHATHWIVLDRDSTSKFIRKPSVRRLKLYETVWKKVIAREKQLMKIAPASVSNEPGLWKFPSASATGC